MTDARITELQSLLPRCLLPDWVRLGSRLVRLLRDLWVAKTPSGLEMIDWRGFVIKMTGLCSGKDVECQPDLGQPTHP